MSNSFPEFCEKFEGFFSWLWTLYLRSPLIYRNETHLVGKIILLSIQSISLYFCALKISTRHRPLKKIGRKISTKHFSTKVKKKNPQNFHKIPGNDFDTFATTGGIFYRKISKRTLKNFWKSQLSIEVHLESVRRLWGPLWAPKFRAILLGQAVVLWSLASDSKAIFSKSNGFFKVGWCL